MLVSLVAVSLCGVAGALAAFALVEALGLGGVIGALVAIVTAVLVATLLFAGGVAVLRSLGWLR